MFSRFDTIPECDRHTHAQTYDDGIYRAIIALRGKYQTVIQMWISLVCQLKTLAHTFYLIYVDVLLASNPTAFHSLYVNPFTLIRILLLTNY